MDFQSKENPGGETFNSQINKQVISDNMETLRNIFDAVMKTKPYDEMERAGRALFVVYGPEALAQASDNLWNLIPGTLLSKILETVAGALGVAVTELVPAVRANPVLYEAMQRFFSHWVTKILDPTPAEWQAMMNEAKSLFSGATFANPGAKLQEIGAGIQQNIQKLASVFAPPKTLSTPTLPSFALPDIGTWFKSLFTGFGATGNIFASNVPAQSPLPQFNLATAPVPAQALIAAPPGQIPRSTGVTTAPPALSAAQLNLPGGRQLFNLSAGIAR